MQREAVKQYESPENAECNDYDGLSLLGRHLILLDWPSRMCRASSTRLELTETTPDFGASLLTRDLNLRTLHCQLRLSNDNQAVQSRHSVANDQSASVDVELLGRAVRQGSYR